MTIDAASVTTGELPGNGSTTEFPFTFKCFDEADLLVTKVASSVRSTLTLDSDYTVALNVDQDGNPGGAVTFPISGTNLQTGETLRVRSNADLLQELDLVNGGGFQADDLEVALDVATLLIGQLSLRIDELEDRVAVLEA